uniref:Uncharacterized protein n=1 Tax=Megaviridae environmental sample TaxID=1737588 RepID=A0A5J6VKJ4_9VIRU|nr:MAG: hypothetical protein [Megaviridae environmental sample]
MLHNYSYEEWMRVDGKIITIKKIKKPNNIILPNNILEYCFANISSNKNDINVFIYKDGKKNIYFIKQINVQIINKIIGIFVDNILTFENGIKELKINNKDFFMKKKSMINFINIIDEDKSYNSNDIFLKKNISDTTFILTFILLITLLAFIYKICRKKHFIDTVNNYDL